MATRTKAKRPRAIPLPLKKHGGKFYVARRIVELMPPHLSYVEPYLGGGSVLLAKDPEGVSEVVNDLDGRLINFWRVLQDESAFARLQRILQAVPFAEAEWRRSKQPVTDPVKNAAAYFVWCRQSLAGRQNSFASTTRNRLRRGMNEQVSAWLSSIDGLPAVHARLKRVKIYSRPALKVIRQQDSPHTLFYLDPTYVHSTRTSRETYGEFEMSDEDHVELLDVIVRVKGMVIISGYRSEMYDDALRKWTRHDFDIANNAAKGKRKRRMVECVWCNWKGAKP